MRPALALIFLGVLGSCACPDAPNLRRLEGQHLGNPEATIEYFREAFLDGTAYDMHLCLSEELKAANPDLTVGNLALYKDRVRDFMAERIGDLEEVEIRAVDSPPGRPELLRVALQSGDRLETILLVQEVTASIQWNDGLWSHFHLPAGEVALSGQDGEWILRLAAPDRPEARSPDIHQIQYSRDWKFLGLLSSDFSEDLKRFLDEERAREAAPAPAAADPDPKT